MSDTSQRVLTWWASLSLMAVLNIAVWMFSSHSQVAVEGQQERTWWRRQRLLSAVFVFGCAFRSFLPRADIQRICLYDSWLSSVFVGRTVATLAELALAIQVSLHLARLAGRQGARAAVTLARLIVPTIVVAECFSWSAVVTLNFLGHVFEESLWASTGALVLIIGALIRSQADAQTRRQLVVPLLGAAAYVPFMVLVDVPMYWERWRADQLAGKSYLAPLAGLQDLAQRWIVTQRLEDWRSEMPWMSLYFSVAVWISIVLSRPAERDATPLHGAALNPATQPAWRTRT